MIHDEPGDEPGYEPVAPDGGGNRPDWAERLWWSAWDTASHDPRVGVHLDSEGRASLYRSGEILVGNRDLDRVVAHLRELFGRDVEVAEPGSDEPRQERSRGLGDVVGFRRVLLPPGQDAVAVVEFLRRQDRRAGHREPEQLQVGVCLGLPVDQIRRLGPADAPRPTGDDVMAVSAVQGRGEARDVTVGVVDSGFVASMSGHPVFDGRLDDIEIDPFVDDANGVITHWVGGHGTFVASRIAEMTGVARLLVRSAVRADLGPMVWEDDAAIDVAFLAAKQCSIINLSLGGPSPFDHSPVGLLSVIRQLPRSVVVVASAGNEGSSRPRWPAALKNVIAVAAVDDKGNPAPFSNHGDWVDCCTGGMSVRGVLTKAGLDVTDPVSGATDHRDFTGEALWSGTSFAAPRVAGLIAREYSTGSYPDARVAAAVVLANGAPPPAPGFGVLV